MVIIKYECVSLGIDGDVVEDRSVLGYDGVGFDVDALFFALSSHLQPSV